MDLCGRLSFLFGTEEYVRMRRGLVLLREEFFNHTLINYQLRRFICSGSLGEGVAYPPSDDDLMMYLTNIRVVKSYREATQRYDLLMVPSEYSPGYCLLLDVNQSYPPYMIHVIDGMPFLSSLLWKQWNLPEGASVHGPCQSQDFDNYDYDFARCIQFSFWPDISKEWISRNRPHCWPSPKIMQNIIMQGCHVVPIGDQTSSYHQHEWRISFSVAERTLMHSFNHVQFLTYNLLRLCLKRVIEKGRPGLLCSYFMKTTLFYTVENTPSQLWQADNINACFKTCLSVLYDYVDHVYCPNYFIPEYNMIKRKINHTNRQPLLDIIRSLHDMGIVGTIHFCGESKCLDERISFSVREAISDYEFLNSLHFSLTFTSLKDFISTNDIDGVLFKLFRLLQRYSACEMGNIIFRHGVIFCCKKLIDRLLLQLRINKWNYSLHKSIETLLRIGYRSDVITGKLTAATYMYLIGKTKSALSHIRCLLSEYPPYAINFSSNNDTLAVYREVMCSRGNTMNYKVRHAHAPHYFLSRDFLNALPPPLRILISTFAGDIATGLYFIDISVESICYTNVLESLCYIRQQNFVLLNKSIRCLVNLDDMIKDGDKTNTRMYIGIIKYEQNDSQSACRWFASAYIIAKGLHPYCKHGKSSSDSIVIYVACLLNRRFRTGR
ncbi:hypothetical protein FSP39_003304 [Pinctada imbricata]|uniref:Uncharacterized protein n=1 Tax=Pinctada imbricata TaxID=66713 RepID=A0AA89BJ27_PINIB|nr:hypothetical protein FSP39_003304 [Pinctada imbricata]